MRVSYLSVEGEILSETRNGVERDYLPDPLGSTAALLDSSQTKTDTYFYWPYGETRSHMGTSQTPFTWVGTKGYYSDESGAYARARTVDKALGRWLTVDPLWPQESAYGYCRDAPTRLVDPSGLSDCYDHCRDFATVVCTVGCILTCGPEDPICIAVCIGGCLYPSVRVCHCLCKDPECPPPPPRRNCCQECQCSPSLCTGLSPLDKALCCEQYCKQRGLYCGG
jgi:RHS repeat-associated protein